MPASHAMSQQLKHSVMAQSARLFGDLSPEEVSGFAYDAQQKAKRSKLEIQSEIEHQDDHIRMTRRRMHEEFSQDGLTSRSCSLRFKPADLAKMHAMLESPSFCWAEVQKLRAKALAPPCVRPLAVMQAFSSCDIYSAAIHSEDKPSWVKALCNHRGIFSGCIFLTSMAEGSAAYLFLSASMSPYFISFLQMRLRMVPLPCLPDLSVQAVLAALASWEQYSFEYEHGAYIGDAQVPFGAAADVLVLHDAFFSAAGSVQANGQLQRLQDLVRVLPTPSRKASTNTRALPASALPDVVVDHPWVQEYMKDNVEEGHRKTRRKATGTSAAIYDGDDDDDEEVEVLPLDKEAIWKALDDKRQEWARGDVAHGSDFVTCVRGGAWWWINKWTNTGIDCVVGQAKASATWCATYKLNKMARFSFAKYIEPIAIGLALEWCRRLQHYYDLWCMQDDAKYRFTPDDLASYTEGQEFRVLLDGVPLGGPLRERVNAIRALVPVNPA